MHASSYWKLNNAEQYIQSKLICISNQTRLDSTRCLERQYRKERNAYLVVMEARTMRMQELQCQTPSSSKMSEHEWFGRSTSHLKESSTTIHEDYDDYSPVSSHTPHYEDTLYRTYPYESTMPSTAYETEKHAVESNDMPFIDKSVIEENPSIRSEDNNVTVGPSSQILLNSYDEDEDDDWPEDDDELYGYSGTAAALIDEEDISFSDLEDDDFQAPSKLKSIPKE